MASEKPSRRNLGQPLLMAYVGICVIAVVLTVVIAFSEASSSAQTAQPTPPPTRTLPPAVMTLQADAPSIGGLTHGTDTSGQSGTSATMPASLSDLSEGH